MKAFVLKHLSRIVALFLWAMILIVFFAVKSTYGLTFLDLAKQLYLFIKDSPYGPLFFILAYTFRSFFLFPSLLLMVMSGTIFGFWKGYLYTIIGSNISASVAFFMAKFFSDDFFQNQKHHLIRAWHADLKRNVFLAVLIMRLIYLPFDIINFGAGLLGVAWRPYALASFLSIFVDSIAFVSFGATLENLETFDFAQITINTFQLVLSFALVGLGVLAALAAYRLRKTISS